MKITCSVFRCFALGCGYDQDVYGMFRTLVAKEIEENRNEYIGFVPPEQFEETLRKIKSDGYWGGDLEIRAFVKRMHVTVILYHPGQASREYKAEPEERRIEIAHLCETHFDLLVPKVMTPQNNVPSNGSESRNDESLNQEQIEKIVAASPTILEAAISSVDTDETLTDLLLNHFCTRRKALEWLESIGLIYASRSCDSCGKLMRRRYEVGDRVDGDFWCDRCRKRTTVRKDNLLYEIKSPLHKVCQVFARWLKRDPQMVIAQETGLSLRTVSRVSQMLRAASVILLQQRNTKIGGPNKVVEIDECLLHRRKFNEGRMKESGWVLGGVERPSTPNEKAKIFLVSVPDRSQHTLEEMIKQWVEKGSIIITDCLRSYNHLDTLGYHHFTVNHSKNFVNPETKAHTQRIEGLWHWVRTKGIPRSRCSLIELDFHLAAFLYRRSIDERISQFFIDLCNVRKAEVDQILKEKMGLQQEYETIKKKTKQIQPSEPDYISDASDRDDTFERPSTPQQRVRETFITSPQKREHILQHAEESLTMEGDLITFTYMMHMRNNLIHWKEQLRRGKRRHGTFVSHEIHEQFIYEISDSSSEEFQPSSSTSNEDSSSSSDSISKGRRPLR